MGDGVLYLVFGTYYYTTFVLFAWEERSVYADSDCGIDIGGIALYQKRVLDCLCACFQQRIYAI